MWDFILCTLSLFYGISGQKVKKKSATNSDFYVPHLTGIICKQNIDFGRFRTWSSSNYITLHAGILSYSGKQAQNYWRTKLVYLLHKLFWHILFTFEIMMQNGDITWNMKKSDTNQQIIFPVVFQNHTARKFCMHTSS